MSESASSARLRILYVEDHALVREITCELLAADDREVVAVSSAEEALNVFHENRFDIVVTDISLPAMSGLDFVRHIKSIAPSMPIIVATGYALPPDHFQLGASVRSMAKPVDAKQLEALILDLCADRPPRLAGTA
jgi:CheY-like chemotaxis protein